MKLALQAALTYGMQEHRFGIEKVELVKLLQLHGVVVKGGPEGGQQLVDALLVGRYTNGLTLLTEYLNICMAPSE